MVKLILAIARLVARVNPFRATPAYAMPLPPANPAGTPEVFRFNLPYAAVAGGSDATTEGFVVPRTGYITAARVVTISAITGANTNTRAQSVGSPSTRSVTDAVTTAGSNVVTSATAAFTQDDVGKVISESGNTHIAASTTIASVTNGTTAVMSANAASAGTAITAIIGSARTALATLQYNSGVNTVAHVETDLALSGTDTKVYKGDVVNFVSTHIGTGIADPGGVVQIELTAYGEGTD